jgi:hypothetical protein
MSEQFISPDEHELVEQDEPMTERAQYIAGLRQIADFYDAHPEVPTPSDNHTNYAVNTDEDARNLAKALGTFKKEYSEDMFTMSKTFGSVQARFVFYRKAICKAKVVGVKTIEAEFVPAVEAYTRPARTVDIIEWDCGSLLDPSVVPVDKEKVDG